MKVETSPGADRQSVRLEGSAIDFKGLGERGGAFHREPFAERDRRNRAVVSLNDSVATEVSRTGELNRAGVEVDLA